ncbi:MAG TPA: class I SAM-dependent methyltransferase [Bryobacteraceae bacterium]|nr:class I SAM-dependent methyltransferase [Bryobacteraceae bacterium]
MRGYSNDLAYIHDSGFTGYALGAAPGLLSLLRKNGVRSGLVVDLGCGSGRWARELNRAGYAVLGIDQSPAMIRLARRIAPRSQFATSSLLSADLPRCDAITSIGECLNYTFDRRNSRPALRELFRRTYRALRPGGVFVFDVAEPSRAPRSPERVWSEAPGWTIVVEIGGNRSRNLLRRRIVTFRRAGTSYRGGDSRTESISRRGSHRGLDGLRV